MTGPRKPQGLGRRWPTIADAKRKARVLLDTGHVGNLMGIDNGRALVRAVTGSGRRHLWVRVQTLVLIDQEGDVRDARDRRVECGPCGALAQDHTPECIRAAGRHLPLVVAGAAVKP